MKKPYLIEFLGMLRAGKTTQIKLLKKHFEQQGKSVHIISDRACARRINTPVDDSVGFNLVMFAFMLEDYHHHKNTVDVILSDRGFNDRRVWFDVKCRLGKISPKRTRELKTTFAEYEPLADQIVCLMVDPATAMERHKKTKHLKVDDLALSLPWLKALHRSYTQHRRRFKKCLWLGGLGSKKKISQKIISAVGSF